MELCKKKNIREELCNVSECWNVTFFSALRRLNAIIFHIVGIFCFLFYRDIDGNRMSLMRGKLYVKRLKRKKKENFFNTINLIWHHMDMIIIKCTKLLCELYQTIKYRVHHRPIFLLVHFRRDLLPTTSLCQHLYLPLCVFVYSILETKGMKDLIREKRWRFILKIRHYKKEGLMYYIII